MRHFIQGCLFHYEIGWYNSTYSETKNIYHSFTSIFFHIPPHVLNAGGPVHQRSSVPARLKVPSEPGILFQECITSESNLPLLSQCENHYFISESQIHDLRASFHSSSARPLAENSHKSAFFKKIWIILMSSDKLYGNIWNSVWLGGKLPPLSTRFVGSGCKIKTEHAHINMDTNIKTIIF